VTGDEKRKNATVPIYTGWEGALIRLSREPEDLPEKIAL
jgi:hypothetical protein